MATIADLFYAGVSGKSKETALQMEELLSKARLDEFLEILNQEFSDSTPTLTQFVHFARSQRVGRLPDPLPAPQLPSMGKVAAMARLCFSKTQKGNLLKFPIVDAKPILIPNLTDIKANFGSTVVDCLVPAFGHPIRNLPTYAPNYKVRRPNLPLLEIQERRFAETNNMKDLSLYQHLWWTINYFFCGNGTFQGQMNRLHEALDQRKMILQKPRFGLLKGDTQVWIESEDQIRAIWNKYWPLGDTPDVKFSGHPLQDSQLTYADEKGIIRSIFKIGNTHANSGMPWVRPVAQPNNKKDSLMSDLAIAELAFMSLKQYRVKEIDKFLKKWSPFLCSWASPKEEVYERAELTSKTRNIFVTSSAFSYPAMMVMQPAHKYRRNCLESEESIVLSGWSPAHGGMKRLLKRISDDIKTKGYSVLVFADNLYIALPNGQDFDFWSLDASKMESCIDMDTVRLYNKHIVVDFWGDKFDASTLPEGYVRWMLQVYPHVNIGPSLIRDWFIVTPQMSSGSVGTSSYNTAKMLLMAATWINSGRPYPESKEFESLTKGVGLKLKIERRVNKVLSSLSTVGAYVDLDILGHAVVVTSELTEGGIDIVGVLQYERFLKSLIFERSDPPKFENLPEPERKEQVNLYHQMLEYVRLKASYLTGGWFYPAATFLISSRLNTLKANIGATTLGSKLVETEMSGLISEWSEIIGPLGVAFVSSLAPLDRQVVKNIYVSPLPPEAQVVLPRVNLQYDNWADAPESVENYYRWFFTPFEEINPTIEQVLNPAQQFKLRDLGHLKTPVGPGKRKGKTLEQYLGGPAMVQKELEELSSQSEELLEPEPIPNQVRDAKKRTKQHALGLGITLNSLEVDKAFESENVIALPRRLPAAGRSALYKFIGITRNWLLGHLGKKVVDKWKLATY